MNTVKKLNLITTIIYIIRMIICVICGGFTIATMISFGIFTGSQIQEIGNIDAESVVAGYKILYNLFGAIGGFFITIILYVLLAIIILEFINTLIPTITNIILRKKYKKTNDVKILKNQTNFNLIYTSISFGFLLLTALQEPEMLIIGIPTIITEIFAIISFIVLNNKKEEVI